MVRDSKVESSQTKLLGPAASYKGPGPAGYTLPSAFGSKIDCRMENAPCFTFGAITPPKLKETSPGPVYAIEEAMTCHGKASAPSFSFGCRSEEPKPPVTPSPSQYDVPIIDRCSTVRKAPAFSVGSRPKPPRTSNVPSPNAYTLPPIISRCGRLKTGDFQIDLAKSPPPNAYATNNLER
eukprot:gene10116-2282_t